MARWRAEALRRLPELRSAIDSAHQIMAFWIDAGEAFRRAYAEQPPNESLIARIYSYADWCLNAPRVSDAGHDPSTAVVVAFFEHVPTIPAAWRDMPRWFTFAEIAESKAIFSYHLSEIEFESLLAHMQRNRRLYRPRLPQSDEP